jgi:hypothetical protein
MSVYWLTSHDGSVSFQCQAADAAQALELLARSQRYESFSDFCGDLGYASSDFRIALIQEEAREYDEEGNRRHIEQHNMRTVTNAFKHLRRLGRA